MVIGFCRTERTRFVRFRQCGFSTRFLFPTHGKFHPSSTNLFCSDFLPLSRSVMRMYVFERFQKPSAAAAEGLRALYGPTGMCGGGLVGALRDTLRKPNLIALSRHELPGRVCRPSCRSHRPNDKLTRLLCGSKITASTHYRSYFAYSIVSKLLYTSTNRRLS